MVLQALELNYKANKMNVYDNKCQTYSETQFGA